METQDKYYELLSLLTEPVKIDGKDYILSQEFYNLYVKGNKISGTRIRKIMQMIRRKAEDVRNDVQYHRYNLK